MRRDPIVKLVGRKYKGVSNKLTTPSATQVNMKLRQISEEISPPELHYIEAAALKQIAESEDFAAAQLRFRFDESLI